MHKIDWCEGGLQLADIGTKNVSEPDLCSEKLHLQSYLEMLWSERGYFGLLLNNIILFIILLYLIER